MEKTSSSTIPKYGLFHILSGHTKDVRSVAISDNILYSAGRDNTIRAWNIDQMTKPGVHHQYASVVLDNWIYSLTACDISKKVIAGCADGVIYICQWDTNQANPSLKLCSKLYGHTAPVCSLSWVGKHLISGSWDETARLWDIENCAMLAVLPGHENNVCVLGTGYSSCITGSTGFVMEDKLAGQQLRWWKNAGQDSCSWEVVHYGVGHEGGIRDICFASSDKKDAVSCSNDGSLKWWSMDDGKYLRTVDLGADYLFSVACIDSEIGLIAAATDAGNIFVVTNEGVVVDIISTDITKGKSVWSVKAIDNCRFAAAYAGGLVCIYSNISSEVITDQSVLEQFLEKTVDQTDFQKLSEITRFPSANELSHYTGQSDGAISIFEADLPQIFQYKSGKWSLLGPLTEPIRKTELDGDYFDQVIPVEIDSASKGLICSLLGVNKGDNVNEVARKFCEKHGLSSSEYVHQIVFFIEANSLA